MLYIILFEDLTETRLPDCVLIHIIIIILCMKVNSNIMKLFKIKVIVGMQNLFDSRRSRTTVIVNMNK